MRLPDFSRRFTEMPIHVGTKVTRKVMKKAQGPQGSYMVRYGPGTVGVKASTYTVMHYG